SDRLSVTQVHIVTRAFGKSSMGLPCLPSSRRRNCLAASNRSGVVLYAEASQPSAASATRRRPASEPQLPIHRGIPPACRGGGESRDWGGAKYRPGSVHASPRSSALSIGIASSRRFHRSSKGT